MVICDEYVVNRISLGISSYSLFLNVIPEAERDVKERRIHIVTEIGKDVSLPFAKF